MAGESGIAFGRQGDSKGQGLPCNTARNKLAGLSVSKAYRKEGDVEMSNWQTPKTNWGQPGQTVPSVDDFNRIEGNIQHLQNTIEWNIQHLQDTKETPAGAQAKVDNHAIQTATLSRLGHVNHAVLTANLDTTWSGTSAPYTKTVSVSGILSTDTPIIDVVMSDTYSTDEARTEAWGYIYRAVCNNGSITFYATEKPTVSLPIQIKVVR